MGMDMETTCSKKTDSVKDSCPSDHHCHPDHAKTIKTGTNKGCTKNSDMDMDTTCSKKTDSVKDSCPSDHHCHPDHAKTIKTGTNKGCTKNSDMDPAPDKKKDNGPLIGGVVGGVVVAAVLAGVAYMLCKPAAEAKDGPGPGPVPQGRVEQQLNNNY